MGINLNEVLWDKKDNTLASKETDGIFEIMKVQSNYIKEDSKGKVLAVFGRLKNISLLKTAESIQKAMFDQKLVIEDMNDDIDEKIIDDKDKYDLDDASGLYDTKTYGFELQNKIYKFRILELELNPQFPVKMKIDQGIFDSEVKNSFRYMDKQIDSNGILCINTLEEYQSVLKIVLRSKKVKYIYGKML